MNTNSLDKFIVDVKNSWTGLNSQTVIKVRELLIELTKASPKEIWLKDIIAQRPPTKELYKDNNHGFILLAHAEDVNTYRIPHDHGAGWVFYAIYSGEMEMTTYRLVTSINGESSLVSRGKDTFKKNDCRVFLPGDVHDTLCKSKKVIQFRLTSCDFNNELKEGRMIRFSNGF